MTADDSSAPAHPAAAAARPQALVVDDQPDFAEFVTVWLESAGYAASYCADGWQAMCAVREREISLIVSDIVMPRGLDGWNMAFMLETLGNKIPVVLMTAYSKDLVADNRALPGNVIGFLQKPFRKNDLLAVLPALPPA